MPALGSRLLRALKNPTLGEGCSHTGMTWVVFGINSVGGKWNVKYIVSALWCPAIFLALEQYEPKYHVVQEGEVVHVCQTLKPDWVY